jgi:hypothetical protein
MHVFKREKLMVLNKWFSRERREFFGNMNKVVAINERRVNRGEQMRLKDFTR